MNKIFRGGHLAGQRTYIVSGIGILSAVGAYLAGDADIFTMLQTIFTLGGIYFLRHSIDGQINTKKTKRNHNGNPKKIYE